MCSRFVRPDLQLAASPGRGVLFRTRATRDRERPASLTIHDIDADRARVLAAKVAHAHPGVGVAAGAPAIDGVEALINASPVGMLADARLPIDVASLPRELVVLDAIVKPERTPLIVLAERCGCTTVFGREMMRGQIAQMVDFFVSG